MEVAIVGVVVAVRLDEVDADRAPAAKGDSSADIMAWYRESQKGHGSKAANGGSFQLTDRFDMASAASADLAPIGEGAIRLCVPVARARKRSR
jgi:hypothetical protein